MYNTLLQYARESWGLLPLLLCVFILGLSVIIERLYYFQKCVQSGMHLQHDLKQLASAHEAATQAVLAHYEGCIQAELLKAAVRQHGRSEVMFEREMDESIMLQLPKLDHNLWLLDTCITLGPLLGLLGTIVHMIEAFSALSHHQGQGISTVTGPIASALVATACGLIVAIVCVVFLNHFNKRIRVLLNQMELIKSMLTTRFATPQN